LGKGINLIYIFRAHIGTIYFVYIGKNILGKWSQFPRKLIKRETFERWSVLPFLFPLKQVTQACEKTRYLQHRHRSNLSSSSFQ
jgi:hypothetical protein